MKVLMCGCGINSLSYLLNAVDNADANETVERSFGRLIGFICAKCSKKLQLGDIELQKFIKLRDKEVKKDSYLQKAWLSAMEHTPTNFLPEADRKLIIAIEGVHKEKTLNREGIERSYIG